MTRFGHGSRTEPFAAAVPSAHYVVMQYAKLLGHVNEPDESTNR